MVVGESLVEVGVVLLFTFTEELAVVVFDLTPVCVVDLTLVVVFEVFDWLVWVEALPEFVLPPPPLPLPPLPLLLPPPLLLAAAVACVAVVVRSELV